MNYTYELSIIDENILKNTNIFFSIEFKNYIKNSSRDLLYIYSEYFIIPVIITKKIFFIYAHFPTEPFQYRISDQPLKEFLNCVCLYLRTKFKIQWINMNSTASLFEDYPSNCKHIPFSSYVIDLSLNHQELLKQVHPKHRNVIKKAEKENVKIISGTSLKLMSDYHYLDMETSKRNNNNINNLSNLKEMIKSLEERIVIYVAYRNNEPQSGAIYFFNHNLCYYMYGANKNKPFTGSGNLLQWQAIVDMKKRGVNRFSFVGARINVDPHSKYYGIQKFKERFGGEQINCHLFKLHYNLFMVHIFNLIITIRGLISHGKFIQSEDIIDQEFKKWNHE